MGSACSWKASRRRHGGPKQAPSWKRRPQPRNTYNPSCFPLLGHRWRIFSIRVSFASSHDANPVVREGMVHVWDFDLRHMAGLTVPRANATGCTPTLIFQILARTRCVTANTDPIVEVRIVNQRFMRVMTCNASEQRVSSAPASALLETVGLKAHVRHTCDSHLNHVAPSTMTCSAKVHRGHRIQLAGIQNRFFALLDSPCFHGRNMFCTGFVTGFTNDACDAAAWVEMVASRGCRGMAPETPSSLIYI
jgi:hypothetical protein